MKGKWLLIILLQYLFLLPVRDVYIYSLFFYPDLRRVAVILGMSPELVASGSLMPTESAAVVTDTDVEMQVYIDLVQ